MKRIAILAASAATLAFGFQAHAVTVGVGDLPTDGTSVSFDGAITANNAVDFYEFSLLGDVSNGDGTYLNLQTFGITGGDLMDTIIALYDSTGTLVAIDDDGNDDGTLTILYSLLSFGDSDPLFSVEDTPAGTDGLVSAGDFTLAVAGFGTTFTTLIGDIDAGGSQGDYTVQLTSNVDGNMEIVPVPAALPLFGAGLAAFSALRRRKAQS
ncbi:MAG: VPLPA-CTERM sorting domain-containing protein [Pseudomonadota bacterium]